MSTIDIDSLVDYLICPLRLSFPGKASKLDDSFKIKSYVNSKLFDSCLVSRIDNQKITISSLNNRLNYIWDKIKGEAGFILTISDKVSIKSKLLYICSVFKHVTTVVYLNIPRIIKVNNSEILYKFSSFYSGGEFISVVKFNGIHTGLSNNSSVVRIVYDLLQRDLKSIDDNYRHKLKLFRCDTAELYSSVACSERVIEEVLAGIENKVFYPRTDYLSCKTCNHNKDCEWSIG